MKRNLIAIDERRLLAIPGNLDEMLVFSVEKWIEYAEESIKDHHFFAVALSGGSTPKAIFQKLSSPTYADQLDWSKVLLFWSDERAVLPTDPESNFRMALEEGGLGKLPIPKNQIFRMVAESDIELNAIEYEKLILEKLGPHPFDLIMLGMGDDGHTASLFPYTTALQAKQKLVVANFIPQKNTWRMTFTYDCIESAKHVCIYVAGPNKSEILTDVLTTPLNFEKYPSQNIGIKENPALWIADLDAAQNLSKSLQF